MYQDDKKRNATQQFRTDAVTFMETRTMTADFSKGLQDNYIIHTDPTLTRPVRNETRSTFEKLTFQRRTEPVSEESQRATILRRATDAVTESGLKTHFFSVMEDIDRPGVFNLTPDVVAYRSKYMQKAREYGALGNGVSPRQQAKLAALERIVDSVAMLEVPRERKNQESEHLKSGYFPYKPNIDAQGNGVGVTDLYSKKNASGRWVFTGQMNGCAIAIENVMEQRSKSAYEVGRSAKAYHFPSPASNASKLERWQEGRQLSNWFGVDGYTSETKPGSYDGFNALYVKGPEVHVITQKQERVMPENHTRATGEVEVLRGSREPLDHRATLLAHTGGVYGLNSVERRPAVPAVEPVVDHAGENRASHASMVRK